MWKIKKNILLNNLNNVQIVSLGISSKRGNMKITNDKGSMKRIINDYRIKNYENIEITTLDAFLKNRKNISMIKIDVEGYEKQVLLGAENTLKNKSLDVIIIELNDSNKFYDYDEEETIKILERYGFKPYQGWL